MQVFYHLYGDTRPRLFIYWTADNYEGTGCYNLKCPGFVQTNKKILLGGALEPTSLYNGQQYEFPLKIWKDEKNGHWWLEYGNGDIIGYWPSSLFKRLQGEGDFAQFGGQVLNLNTTGFHTSTQMGSGHFDSGRFKKAAYIRNMQVAVNSENIWIDLPDPEYGANKPGCYDVRGRYSRNWGNLIFYGGPGRNANCR
ncbi:putative neprosin [Medicago truncatula]|uniref:Putative neprosin n=1 Tax=Medicago truncatula TaxID=3880 RepID=A0A396GML8_MEDTR|nr:putative neprosin [Medicago truncatula]